MNDEANYRKAIRMQAKMPAIVTAFARVRKGEEPVAPEQDLGFAANFLYMLTGNEPMKLKLKHLTKPLFFMQIMN